MGRLEQNRSVPWDGKCYPIMHGDLVWSKIPVWVQDYGGRESTGWYENEARIAGR